MSKCPTACAVYIYASSPQAGKLAQVLMHLDMAHIALLPAAMLDVPSWLYPSASYICLDTQCPQPAGLIKADSMAV